MNPNMVDEFFGNKGVRISAVVALGVLSLFLVAKTWAVVDGLSRTQIGNVATITVTGTGKASLAPNVALIGFTVQENATTVAAAQEAATKRTDAALAAIKKLGIADKDVKTNGYNVSPQYENAPCRPGAACPQSSTIIGYQVSQSVEVKVRDTAKAGGVLQALGTAGVQNVSGPNFTIDDESGVQAEARGKAITDARTKANALARQLGVRLGNVVGFSESGGMPYPMYYGGATKVSAMNAVAVAPPTLPVGENETTTTVSVTYEIR